MMVVMPSCCKVLEVLGVPMGRLGGEEVRILKKFKFRMQVVLDMRQHELEERQMEAAKILAALKKQESELQEIIDSQVRNSEQMESLYTLNSLDIQQIEAHRVFGLKLIVDAKNKERIIANTKLLFERKQIDEQLLHCTILDESVNIEQRHLTVRDAQHLFNNIKVFRNAQLLLKIAHVLFIILP